MARRADGARVETVSAGLEPELREAYALLAALLAGCAVRGIVPDRELVSWADADALLDVASEHLLAAAAASVLASCGLGGDRARGEVARGLWRGAQMEADWRLVADALDEAGIWYCPIKGARIRGLWPAGLRQMADYDVLFDEGRAGDVRLIMEGLGLRTESFGRGDHDVYMRPPVTNIEMHRRLFGKGKDPSVVAFWSDVGERLLPDGRGGCGRAMDETDGYLYLVAHAHKHWSGSGTGLRILPDVYACVRGTGGRIDWGRVSEGAEAMGISHFERELRGLSTCLLEGRALTAAQERMLSRLCGAGAYGTVEVSVANRVAAYGGGLAGRARYVWRRLVPTQEALEAGFPLFARHRALLPALLAWRLGRALTTRRARAASELKALASLGRDGWAWHGGNGKCL